jgi:hypothetical protein
MDMEREDDIALEPVSIREPGLRLLSEFSGRREQLLTRRAVRGIMLLGIFNAQ